MSLYIVSGAPGSGKTTFVKQNFTEGDIAIDLDYICAALALQDKIYFNHRPLLDTALQVRSVLYKLISSRRCMFDHAWIITTEADERKVNQLAEKLSATVIEMETTPEECIRRIKEDHRRPEQIKKEMYKSVADFYRNKSRRKVVFDSDGDIVNFIEK